MTDRQAREKSMTEPDPPDSATDADVEEPRMPLGPWLVENMPRGTNLEIPRDRVSHRPIPFIDDGNSV